MGMTFLTCTRCRAVIGIETEDSGGFSYLEEHAGWHRGQDDLFKALHDALAELGGAVMELGSPADATVANSKSQPH